MDIATQLKIMLANQERIMRNQVMLLAEHRANYGAISPCSIAELEHIEGYEEMITETGELIELTRQTRMAL